MKTYAFILFLMVSSFAQTSVFASSAITISNVSELINTGINMYECDVEVDYTINGFFQSAVYMISAVSEKEALTTTLNKVGAYYANAEGGWMMTDVKKEAKLFAKSLPNTTISKQNLKIRFVQCSNLSN